MPRDPLETLRRLFILARNQPFAAPGPYVTTLPPEQEQAFRQWVKANNVPFDPSDPYSDYDMRGFFKALITGDPIAKTAINPVDKRLHFPDAFKTPYHESFSAESRYATQDNPFNWQGQTLVDARNKSTIYKTKPEPR